MLPRVAMFAAALVFVPTLGVGAGATPCSAPIGTPVTLRSSDFDPDVFVWDSRGHVVEYAGGHWKNASDVMTHTLLAKPGTKAIVVACEADRVRSRYAAAELEDTIGVRILSGANKGKYGWVMSADVHGHRLPAAVVTSP